MAIRAPDGANKTSKTYLKICLLLSNPVCNSMIKNNYDTMKIDPYTSQMGLADKQSKVRRLEQ